MLRVFSTADIGPVPNNIGKIAQKRQLFRSQVHITDNLSGNVVIDVHRIGLSAEGGPFYNNAFCGFEDALVDVLQRTFETLPRQGRFQTPRPGNTVLRLGQSVAAHLHRRCVLPLGLGRHFALVRPLDGSRLPHPNILRRLHTGGGVLCALCGVCGGGGISTLLYLRACLLRRLCVRLTASTLSDDVNTCTDTAHGSAHRRVIQCLAEIEPGRGIIGGPLQNGLENILNKFLAALEDHGEGHTARRAVVQLG